MAKVQTFHTLLSSLTAGVRFSVCHVVFSRVVALPQECKCVCVPVNSFITALGSHSSVLQLKSPQSRQIPAIQRHFIQLNIITGEKKKEQSHPPNKSEELMQCAL